MSRPWFEILNTLMAKYACNEQTLFFDRLRKIRHVQTLTSVCLTSSPLKPVESLTTLDSLRWHVLVLRN